MWGEYPAEYNARVHGPYDPARYYGKADKPLSEVRLGELGKWLLRRDFTIYGIARAFTRARFKFFHQTFHAKHLGLGGILQFWLILASVHYVWHHRGHQFVKPVKYSW